MHRVVILAAVLVVSGCGGNGKHPLAHRVSQAEHMKAVVRAWSERLNAGDNKGIAALFGLPTRMIQGPYVYLLEKRTQIARWHSTLPCAGRIVSITTRGPTATAVFRLGNRKATHC